MLGIVLLKTKFITLIRDTIHHLEIYLIKFIIQNVRPNHFSKELLKFIFNTIRFHKNIRIIKNLNWRLKDSRCKVNKVTISLSLFFNVNDFMQGWNIIIRSYKGHIVKYNIINSKFEFVMRWQKFQSPLELHFYYFIWSHIKPHN